MNKLALLIALLIVSSLLISACSRQETAPENTITGEQTIEPVTETAQYIDSQLVDPEETVEIGEMI